MKLCELVDVARGGEGSGVEMGWRGGRGDMEDRVIQDWRKAERAHCGLQLWKNLGPSHPARGGRGASCTVRGGEDKRVFCPGGRKGQQRPKRLR